MPWITQVDGPTSWRQRLVPASFRGAEFHVESGALSAGRRTKVHEFPKRNVPYAEDMGHRAYRWPIQGYIIVAPWDLDYIPARDELRIALDADGPGILIHPTMGTMTVMCEMYSMEERREAGGICRFDMMFVERGSPVVYDVTESTGDKIGSEANAFADTTSAMINNGLSGSSGLNVKSYTLLGENS